jgi:predicted HAD superfamily Cof-like phosphohydrolase
MSTSNYQQIVEFHKAFGLEHHDIPQPHVLTEKPDLVKFRMSLINEEHEETKEATANNDLVETIDGLTDMLYVIYGTLSSYGIDGDHAFSLVHKSNMSKLCVSETEAQETVQWYKDNEDRYDSPEYRRADIGDYWVVFNKSTGKILKSVNYKPVSFKEMLE